MNCWPHISRRRCARWHLQRSLSNLPKGREYYCHGGVAGGRASLMALCAISDPVRSDVPAAVRECLNAGIHVKIVTGDTPGTAREIGRQIGLWTDLDTDDAMITGTEFAALSNEALLERVQSLKIIARARPMDKKRLVEALQQKGEVVAVTGDGTNDAPALKAAHVGLSMGDGTAVAKEASDITIIDNSFASIGRAVMWGRSLYQNIQRFILFQMTVNVCACLVVLAGAFLGTQSPLTVTQMLWVNLIMDTFAAMALASLPHGARNARQPPLSSGFHHLQSDVVEHPHHGWHLHGIIAGCALALGERWHAALRPQSFLHHVRDAAVLEHVQCTRLPDRTECASPERL